MTNNSDELTLNFFRVPPPGLTEKPPLASSLQSFETCLMLVGLRRYPAALVACGTAWESAIKAKLGIGPEDTTAIWQLQERIRSAFAALVSVSDEDEREFRKTRNQIVHFGYAPKDDELCASLLLKTGFPYLKVLYKELFGFYLDWREILPEREQLSALTSSESAKASLIPPLTEHLRNALRAYEHVKAKPAVEKVHCIAALSHYVLTSLQASTMSRSELATLAVSGQTWEAEDEVTRKLDEHFRPSEHFTCPVCRSGTLVAELDEHDLGEATVTVRRCECVECGFRMDSSGSYLTNMLLADQVVARRAEILRGYGVDGSKA